MPRIRRTHLLLAVVLTLLGLIALRWPYLHSRVVGGPERAHPLTYAGLPPDAFQWSSTAPPPWLSARPGAPLHLRIAIITHPAEYSRRAAIRRYVLAGVPASEVVLEHKFFVGRTTVRWWQLWKPSAAATDAAVDREIEKEGDVVRLDIPDNKHGLGTKRWEALQWGGRASAQAYDWFFTMDSDSFVRLAALARRSTSFSSELRNPRTRSVMWAQMLSMDRHWKDSSHVPVSQRLSRTAEDKRWWSGDESMHGEWYDYPVGLGYLIRCISSPLLHCLPPPHSSQLAPCRPAHCTWH
jgi:hypothetical protein